MTIELPCFGIVIETNDGAGKITSDLKNETPGVKYPSGGEITPAMDAIESLILAHACAGVDVASPAYIEGIEIAVEACWNQLG